MHPARPRRSRQLFIRRRAGWSWLAKHKLLLALVSLILLWCCASSRVVTTLLRRAGLAERRTGHVSAAGGRKGRARQYWHARSAGAKTGRRNANNSNAGAEDDSKGTSTDWLRFADHTVAAKSLKGAVDADAQAQPPQHVRSRVGSTVVRLARCESVQMLDICTMACCNQGAPAWPSARIL